MKEKYLHVVVDIEKNFLLLTEKNMNWLATLVDYGIIGILLLLSILVVTLATERFLFFRRLDPAQYTSRNVLELHLSRNMHLIGTIAGNTPYVGLLGTVLGIMMTFHTISTSSHMETEAIMVGLSLALKATAIGLVVAIIAVALYNLLVRKTKDILLQWDIRHER